MLRAKLSVAVMGILLGAHAGCSGSSKTSGETHWLGACDRASDCDDGEQCLCGVCSRGCSGDGDCDGPHTAECFLTASPGLAAVCGKLPSNGGICLATCSKDLDCPKSDACYRGGCIAARSSAGALDGGKSEDGAASGETSNGDASSGQLASRYVHFDAGVTFDGAVVPPDPSPLVYGADETLVGHWAEFGSDGERCTPEHNGGDGPAVCMQLEITNDAARGGYLTTAYWLRSATAAVSTNYGPFAPATDPDRGYPTEVTPEQYRVLEARSPDRRYTAFEGRFADDTLSFWISGAELWSGWCELQTPYPFQAAPVPSLKVKGYRCVPQEATMQNTDFSKLVLCTTIFDLMLATGVSIDCTPGVDGGVNPMCFQYDEECSCFAKGCKANLRAQPTQFSLKVSSTSMLSMLPDAPLTLRKVPQ